MVLFFVFKIFAPKLYQNIFNFKIFFFHKQKEKVEKKTFDYLKA